MLHPVLPAVVELCRVPAVLVCADVRAQIMYQMSLPRLIGESLPGAQGEAVRTLEELVRASLPRQLRRGRELDSVMGGLPC